MIGYYFTYLLLAIGTSMGWMRPFLGLMIYYAFAILRPPFLWFWAFNWYDPPRLSFWVGLSTLAGWAATGFGDWSGLRGTRIAMAGLLVYLLAGLYSWQTAAVWYQYAGDMLELQFKIILVLFATLTLVREPRSILIFVWVIIAAHGYVAYTLNEWYQISPMYLHNNGFGGIDNNGVGMIMVMTVPMAFFMAVYDKRIWVRLLAFASCAYAVHAILFSFSRGSQLGLCMVGAAIFFFAMFYLPRKLLTLACAAIFVALALRLAGDQVRERFMSIFADPSERDASAESRFVTWRAAWECIKEHPLGVGPRNFGFYAPQYGLTKGKAVHNLYLQAGADYGVPGALGLITFYLISFVNTFRMARTKVAARMVWPKFLGMGVCTSLGGFLVCSIFIGMESVESGYMIAVAGLTAVAYVNRVRAAGTVEQDIVLPELAEVPALGHETVQPDWDRTLPPHGPGGELRPAFQ